VLSLAGSFNICNRGLNNAFCFSAQRSAQPTALGGVATVSSLGVTYEQTLSQVDSLAISGRYGKTDQSAEAWLPTLVRNTDILSASANYRRKLGDRMSVFISPSFARVYDTTQKRDSNFTLSAGLSRRFGRLR
jgi:hypothetical protein